MLCSGAKFLAKFYCFRFGEAGTKYPEKTQNGGQGRKLALETHFRGLAYVRRLTNSSRGLCILGQLKKNVAPHWGGSNVIHSLLQVMQYGTIVSL